jgi:uncharacterized pyridoxamine 5'-phosphate oxidase family protein
LRKKSTILNPLWITQGSYLDPEYFNYVLLAATKSYKEAVTLAKKTIEENPGIVRVYREVDDGDFEEVQLFERG